MLYTNQFPQQDSPASNCSNTFEYLTPQSSPLNELNSSEHTIDILRDRLQEPYIYSQDIVSDLSAEIAENVKMDTDMYNYDEYLNKAITDDYQCSSYDYQNNDSPCRIPCVESFQNIYENYEPKVMESNATDELNTPQITQRNPFIFSINPVQSQELKIENTETQLPDYFKQNTPLSVYNDDISNDCEEESNEVVNEEIEEIDMENSTNNTVSVALDEENNLQQQQISFNELIPNQPKTIIVEPMAKPTGTALRRSLRQRSSPLKLQIEQPNESNPAIGSPEILNTILDMETDRFDIVAYVLDDVVSLMFYT